MAMLNFKFFRHNLASRLGVSANTSLFKRVVVISGIPLEVKGFISRYINSVWQLETLLCLKRAGSLGICIQDIVKELYIADNAISMQLSKFVANGFAIKDQKGNFKYSPTTVEIANTVDLLENLYYKRRVAITDLIYRQSSQSLQAYRQPENSQNDDGK